LQCKKCNGDKYHCYECENSFCNGSILKKHNDTEKHKRIYNVMLAETFG